MHLVVVRKIGKGDLDPTNKRDAFSQCDIICVKTGRPSQLLSLCEFLHLLCKDLDAHS